MAKKIKFIIVLISFSVCLCLMSSTYSRYVSDTTGNIQVLFAKWQILVNNNDITNGSNSSIDFTPVMESNINVASDVVAPSSKGYFDIAVNPTNVDVSFKYTIDFEVLNTNIPDLMISKYAVLPDNFIEGDPLEYQTITDGSISYTMNYDNETVDFSFKPFTIRVYFEWIEGTDEVMNDETDTAVATDAETNDTKLQIKADIKFEQVIAN